MNIEVKRNELSNWIENLGEDMLTILDELRKSTSSKNIVSHTSKGKALNKKEYTNHIENISKSVREGSQTYTTDEVRKSILKK